MYFKVDLDTIIRGHHVYKSVWTPVVDEILECEKDTRTEAKEHDENAIGVYKPPGPKGTKQPNLKKTLAGHVPIELSHLLTSYVQTLRTTFICKSHWQKKERNQTSCTSKILGCYHRIAHRRSFRERAKQQSNEV